MTTIIQHERINQALIRYLPPLEKAPKRLHEAMRYAVLNGGKRLRPALVYATGESLGVPLEKLDIAACAVEFIHAYSLIHDDLPAMDNDDFRRGLPTCHKAFDEATAILAGDALQVLAFQILADAVFLSADQRIKMISTLAHACGSFGMAGGQAMDLASTGKIMTESELETLHRCKTGALIQASVALGIIISASSAPSLILYARALGLAFQIQDDILDNDAYSQLVGLDAAKNRVQMLYNTAIHYLSDLGDAAKPLQQLTHSIIHRQN
ncbi:MAG: farnesyl diphosphate synthase [Gammaproteobacteria bacterium]